LSKHGLNSQKLQKRKGNCANTLVFKSTGVSPKHKGAATPVTVDMTLSNKTHFGILFARSRKVIS
jgi:hypothetical protein